MDSYELVRKDGSWKLRQFRSRRALRSLETKAKGMDFSADCVREHKGALKIKKLNGEVPEERTYPRTADPPQTPG
jgi:Uncharacterized protein conserved in bacteria (DUF2188)